MKNLFYLLLIVTLSTLSSCYYDNEEHLYGLAECGIEPKSYETDVAPIISKTCNVTGCHDGSQTNFKSYEGVASKLLDINQRINEGSMPPTTANQLSAEEITIITCWIDQGGLDN